MHEFEIHSMQTLGKKLKQYSNKIKIFLGTCNEPPLPRRKKCPELAYKTHEFINCDQSASNNYRNDNNSINRARVRHFIQIINEIRTFYRHYTRFKLSFVNIYMYFNIKTLCTII